MSAEKMSAAAAEPWMTATLGSTELNRISSFVQTQTGIQLPPSKGMMLQTRLRRRLRALKCDSFEEYCEVLFRPGSSHPDEIVCLVNALTTNKTDFFRESRHFDFLSGLILKQLAAPRCRWTDRPLEVWSAGCSTGEEPYTLSMVLHEIREVFPSFRFKILATDVSTDALSNARNAIYSEETVETVPLSMRKKYLLRSRVSARELVKVAPHAQSPVTVRKLNLMDRDFGIEPAIDLIFCRNVMIYFDEQTCDELVHRFCRQLAPGGHLFVGHSEAIQCQKFPLKMRAPSVYRLEKTQ